MKLACKFISDTKRKKILLNLLKYILLTTSLLHFFTSYYHLLHIIYEIQKYRLVQTFISGSQKFNDTEFCLILVKGVSFMIGFTTARIPHFSPGWLLCLFGIERNLKFRQFIGTVNAPITSDCQTRLRLHFTIDSELFRNLRVISEDQLAYLIFEDRPLTYLLLLLFWSFLPL